MIAGWEARLLRWLRVPPEPHPPAGSPGSLRVFRAGRNFLRLRLVVWTGAQIGAIFGVLVSLSFIREIEIQHEVSALHNERAEALAAAGTPPAEGAELVTSEEIAARRTWIHRTFYEMAPPEARHVSRIIPPRALFWIKLGEALALVGYLGQLVGSFAIVFLDFRQRWYMVTDRSLRLRWGIVNVHEATMSFANLQQVSVRQGPLQRVLGLWDVEVESAGGGSGKTDHEDKDSMHRAVFHGVEEGPEIRDVILARLRRFREAGLGDPDDVHAVIHALDTSSTGASGSDAAQAARDVLAEVRALREALRE